MKVKITEINIPIKINKMSCAISNCLIVLKILANFSILLVYSDPALFFMPW